jgi:PAS domain S-box-containing protein
MLTGLKRRTWVTLFLVGPVPLGAGLLLRAFGPAWRWEHHPVHALVEGAGALVALIVAGLIFLMRRSGQGTPALFWAACALLGMGVLDGFHAATHAGRAFVWLHSIATFVGGMLFASVWLPDAVTLHPRMQKLPLVIIVVATYAAVLSLVFSDQLPAMTDAQGFTWTARSLNFLGGVGFLAAAWLLIRRRAGTGLDENLLFAHHCLLFGVAGLVFLGSALWDASWWLWHFLRLVAYLVVLFYFFDMYRLAFRAAREAALGLEKRVAERTRELTDEIEARQQAEEALARRNQDLEAQRGAALNLAQDAEEARRRAEQNEQELARANAELRFLNDVVEQATQPFGAADFEGRLIRFNRAFECLTGYDAAELRAMTFMQLTPEHWHEMERRQIAELLATGTSVRYEKEYRRKDGTIVPIELTVDLYRNAAGEPQYLYAFVADISGRKQAEEQIQKANAFLDSIVEHLPLLLFVKRADDLCYERVNRAGTELLGVPQEDLLGRSDHDLYPREQAEFFTARDREALASKRLVDIPEEPIQTRHGERILHTRKIPILDGQGNPLHLLGIAEDITERKRAEEALRITESRWRTLVQTVTDYITMIDRAGAILFINHPPPGVLLEDVIGTSVYLHLPPDHHEAFRSALEYVFQTGKPTSYEVASVLPRVGALRWFSTRMGPVQVEGRVTAVTAISTDITERRQAEERLRQLAAELARSNAELEQFAYIASHDLQEPLRKVQAFGDMLVARYPEALGEEGRDYLQRMQNASKRMQALINDLLTFSRVTTKGRPFAQVNLAEVAGQVVADLEARIRDTGGQVEIGELPVLDADPTQMRQLLQNLIGNALKFHRQGEPPRVKVHSRLLHEGDGALRHDLRVAGAWAGDHASTEPARSCCEIMVQDNGIGFEEKYCDRIFAPFQRLHGRGEYEGTGIGLAICKKIVERHGGAITARSSPGLGATFLVTLPLRQTKGAVQHE